MANFQITNVRIRIKQDTKANWNSSTLVPLKGEMCLATDTGELRYGDGTNTWARLSSIGKISKPDGTNGILSVNGVPITIYELPIATANTLGGIKSGGDITINDSTGIASITNQTNAYNSSSPQLNAFVRTMNNSGEENEGKIDPNLVVAGADLITDNKIKAKLLTDTITGSQTESGTTTNTEVDMASKVETTTNGETTVTYSQNYVLNAVNI